jgi:hypothetical protein
MLKGRRSSRRPFSVFRVTLLNQPTTHAALQGLYPGNKIRDDPHIHMPLHPVLSR